MKWKIFTPFFNTIHYLSNLLAEPFDDVSKIDSSLVLIESTQPPAPPVSKTWRGVVWYIEPIGFSYFFTIDPYSELLIF